MHTKPYTTIVIMPNDSQLEVTYHCTDVKMKENEKEKLAQLFIQLHDCICSIKIEKSITKKRNELESIVHNKVIHERGHLC
ncbi:MAG: hypothetical protein ABIO81_08390 [Ginsengibacter sp.]